MNRSCSAQAKTHVACPWLWAAWFLKNPLYNEKIKNQNGIPISSRAAPDSQIIWLIPTARL